MSDKPKKKPEEKKGGVPEYMLTYGDMMTLLLCFFVLLLSMAKMDAKKFKLAASSFQNAFNGVLEELPTVAIHEEVLTPRLGGDKQNRKISLHAAKDIKQKMKKEELDDAVKVKITDMGIAITIGDLVGFSSGDARIKPEFASVLNTILDVIKKLPSSEIRVEGHTDDTPIRTSRYPSNWELSAARALSVVKYLHKNGRLSPAKLSAVGYGEYRPLVPNNSRTNRKKNRRIEIYVEYLEKKQ